MVRVIIVDDHHPGNFMMPSFKVATSFPSRLALRNWNEVGPKDFPGFYLAVTCEVAIPPVHSFFPCSQGCAGVSIYLEVDVRRGMDVLEVVLKSSPTLSISIMFYGTLVGLFAASGGCVCRVCMAFRKVPWINLPSMNLIICR